jgi:DNA-binding NtrC family response regulator
VTTAPHIDSPRLFLAGTADWIGAVAATLAEETDAVVQTGETATETLAAIEEGRIDCLVTAPSLGDGTGLSLLETVCEESAIPPVILGATDGSEAVP